jgi:EAL domain-containing protein (putative c-di-GMP-specific phosphodiesterase class I)
LGGKIGHLFDELAMNQRPHFDLRAAIAADRLTLFFQPRMSDDAERIIGAEALLRWSPCGKEWSGVPGLSDMEREDFDLLWRWTMHHLVQVVAALRARGWNPRADARPFFLSLNVSQKQLASDQWARELLALLAELDLPGSAIEVELTEQSCALDHVLVSVSLERLRAAGVSIALDDFPEGGSSFLLLSRFQFDKVKLDRCMVPMEDEAVSIRFKKKHILEDLLNMIERNNASSVLEGVEKPVQHRFLHCLSIKEWQGYLWGRPMPLQSLMQHLDFQRHAPLLAARA